MGSSSVRWILLSVAAAVVPFLAAGGAGSEPQAPSLRVFSPLRHVEAMRFPGDPAVWIAPAVYVASTGGSFELQAVAGDNGSISVWQVRREGDEGAHRLRQIATPAQPTFSEGLPAFFQLALRDSSGKLVARAAAPFCPAGSFGESRLDPTGPDRPMYPFYCGSALTKATVWGIDAGWAAAPGLALSAPNASDGEYTVTVSIDSAYAKQLSIPPSLATATIGVTITTAGAASPRRRFAPPASGAAGPSSESTHNPAGVSAAEQSGNDGVHEGGHGGVPDLAALPANDLAVEHGGDGHDYLDFGATIWNAGPGPLVIEGFRAGDAPFMTATQFVYEDGSPQSSAVIGRFEFDTRPGHDHWHVEDIAQYDLLDASGSRVVLSDKQSFCLAPTDPVDLTRPGANWQPDRSGLWSACAGPESIWLREVLPAGWGDTYIQTVAGQSFDITTLPNGRYQLRITANPFHRILETSFDNNSSLLPIEIGGTPGARTITTRTG
jgi:hypothetical protein